MDAETGSALQQLADTKLGGRLREWVETMRRLPRPDNGWREIAADLTQATGVYIGKSTLHRWAEDGGWDVNPATGDAADDRAAS